ncbi:MAG: TonB-dependent receptor [Pseudomonadales bacterium]|nr:TonB-dependent receptor [Pseudomonadales bacterium]
MNKPVMFRRKAVSLGVMLGLASLGAQAQNQNEVDIEEVIVTGSYLRGSPLDAPSPVQIVDRASMEAQGAAVLWDVIKNLEVNSGSFTNPGSGEASQTEGTSQVNLRNLGENSTLTLINGKRVAPAAATTTGGGEFVDLNTIPLVMTERVEILTDGGSALYGADAVAGVVNIIMRTDFEGVEIYGDVQGVEEASGAFDATVSAIWGWASDSGNTHLVLSAERFERDEVSVRDGNFFDENSEFLGTVSAIGGAVAVPSFGANLNPAFVATDIIAQNVAEGGLADARFRDPLCGSTEVTSADGTPFFTGTRRETRGERTGTCREDNSKYNFISQESERTSFAGAFSHAFNESVEFYSFFSLSETETIRADDGSNAARGPTVFLAQPGAYTRNPAFGGNAIGQTMELGFFAPAIGLTRPTAADITNAPVDIRNGGINTAFWANPIFGLPRSGDDDNETETRAGIIQTGLRGDFQAFDRSFNYDVSLSFSESSLEQTYRTFNRERAELAANGLGGPNCTPNGVSDFDFAGQPGPFGGAVPQAWDFFDSGLTQTFFPGFVFTTRESLSLALTSNNHGQDGCQFYNPFLSQFTNENVANSQELMEWMNVRAKRADKRNQLAVFDAVISGDLFELRGGTAQFAIGGHYSERNAASRAPDLNDPGLPDRILSFDENGVPNAFHDVSNNFECAQCIFNFSHDREVKAVFAEFSLPFWDNFESQIAVRWEDYGENIGSEVSPKIALSWRPIDSLLLRASFSESFRAPNIGIIQEGFEAGSITFRDPLSNQAVRAGLLPPTSENAESEQTFTTGGPAPNVGNESADTFGFGFIWTPGGRLEGLSVQTDFWRFEVEDRVIPEPGISALQPELDAFKVAVQDPNNFVLNSSISTDSPELFVPCNPNDLEAQFGRDSAERLDCVVDPRVFMVDGIQRAANSETANLITLTLRAVNAGTITADGADVKLGYNWDNDWGRFRVSADYTHVRKYLIRDVPGLELGLLDTGVLDAAGTTGDGNIVRSLPDNKGNITFSWTRNNHGVTIINRHIGSYKDLAFDTTFEFGNDLVRSLVREEIESYDTWDIQYRYNKQWGNPNLGNTVFTVGVLDAFDEDLPFRENSALNFDSTVFDGRGRRFYARALWQF